MAKRFGRYETLRPIASGGMATVHLGRALGVGGFERLVAIKVMHDHVAQEPDFVAMFLDEARMAARIHHPNVVPTIDVQQTAEGLFLIMEYVAGPSLHAVNRKLAPKGERLPLPVVLRVSLDLLAGLHAAHELTDRNGEPLELVHRDVSPPNILIGTDGVTRITDFGVARARSRLATTQEGHIKGKLAYMPREQVLDEPLDRRTDVYAAGVTLWEMLTGRPLFRADTEAALLHMVLESTAPRPRELVDDVPETLDRICMTALAPEQHERYDSALALSEALEHAIAEEGIVVATPRSVAAFIQKLGAHEPVDLASLDAADDGPEATTGDAAGGTEKSYAAAEDGSPSASAAEEASHTRTAAIVSVDREDGARGTKPVLAFTAGLISAAVLATLGYLVLSDGHSSESDSGAPGLGAPLHDAAHELEPGTETRPSADASPLPTVSATASNRSRIPPRRWPAPAKTYNPRKL